MICLFIKQISTWCGITLLNYLFTAPSTCVISAACYCKHQINVSLISPLSWWRLCYDFITGCVCVFHRNLFQSNCLCHVADKWKQRPPALWVKSVTLWHLPQSAQICQGTFNTLHWWSKSIKFIQAWRRLWLSYTSALPGCVDHELKKKKNK